MDNLDKHFLQTSNACNPSRVGRNPLLREPGRVSNAHSVFSMNFDHSETTLDGSFLALPQYKSSSNTLDSKKLVLG